jgi:hypothetical protein
MAIGREARAAERREGLLVGSRSWDAFSHRRIKLSPFIAFPALARGVEQPISPSCGPGASSCNNASLQQQFKLTALAKRDRQ